jgi:hypothetical protein
MDRWCRCGRLLLRRGCCVLAHGRFRTNNGERRSPSRSSQ